MIGVLLDLPEERNPVRCFYAVGKADRAVAEWLAADRALTDGRIATSAFSGVEPVEAVAAISTHTAALMGLRPGDLKALGSRWPRRWLPKADPTE
jgi:hypothetical protein